MPENCTIIKMMPHDNQYGCATTKGFEIFKHWHQELEFIFVSRGSLDISVEDILHPLSQNQFMIVSSGTLHAFVRTSPDACIWVARIYPNELFSIHSKSEEQLIHLYQKTLILSPDDRLSHIFQELIFSAYGSYNEWYTQLKASEFSIELLSSQHLIVSRITTSPVRESEAIVRMQIFIENMISQKITLQMLAEHLGFSVSYCSKYIKEKTNLTFLDYLNQIRIRKAEEYLRTTDHSITEIAYSSGFNSIQTFNRIFKKNRGLSPTDYRKTLRNPA